jgi:uncharacterized membrane protein
MSSTALIAKEPASWSISKPYNTMRTTAMSKIARVIYWIMVGLCVTVVWLTAALVVFVYFGRG